MTDTKLALSFPDNTPLEFISINNGIEVWVRLMPDGTIEFGPDYNPTETTRIFWEHLAATNPLRKQVEELQAEVLRLAAALQQKE